MQDQARCDACVYFDDHAANGARAADDAGLCPYDPPVSQPDPDSRGLWPVVKAEDWCGHVMAPRIARSQPVSAQ